MTSVKTEHRVQAMQSKAVMDGDAGLSLTNADTRIWQIPKRLSSKRAFRLCSSFHFVSVGNSSNELEI
ncbi:hypothetical protein TNCT_384561 [Trichonephila clavata]|uniref:Uncharacterized protein n=1 Tax=Trichonephila clavata TaxID=2740835 RepID=A0A8X6KGS4_TRICU|nr:hypothetical protein TNCT_384561 [Trichonephila clavata]